jgi:effector-binding domain-containing protein
MEPELFDAPSFRTAVVRGTVPTEKLRDFFDSSFRALGAALSRQGVDAVGPAFGVFRGPLGDSTDLEVGFPVDAEIRPDGDVVPGSLPGGPVARLTHVGGYDALPASWDRLEAWMRARGLSPAEAHWESYVTQPSPEMEPADLRTLLVWPVTGQP